MRIFEKIRKAMKRILCLLATVAALSSCSVIGKLNTQRLQQGGLYLAQALILTDDQVKEYVHQYVVQMDAESQVLPASSPYTKRLNRLVANFKSVDGQPLNFKVYKENEINAFACADGSVRVYTGIMDAMTDQELLGVIGHEIGHVAMHHTRKQMQVGMVTSATLQGLASTSDKVAALTDSQLGALGEYIVNAKYSRVQESEADDYGYDFLVKGKKNPWAMVMAFEKLQKMDGGSGKTSVVANLFSSHPNTATRIERMSRRCQEDGYKRPAK